MRKLTTITLIFVMVFGVASLAATDSQADIGREAVDVTEDIGSTFRQYSDGVISRSKALSNLEEYNARTRFLLESAVESKVSLEAIQIVAGLDMVVDLYRQGLEEVSVEKIKLANSIVETVLTPKAERWS